MQVETVIMSLGQGKEEILLRILDRAFGPFHNDTDARALLSSPRFDPNACFIAGESGSPVGSVAVPPLPRKNWFVIRYLAVGRANRKSEIAEKLLVRAREYTKARGAEFVRATTPAIQPYIGIYKKQGFVPARRDFRISWDVDAARQYGNTSLRVEEVSKVRSREAASVFVTSLSPIWDWRTAEQGGPGAVADSFCEGLKHSEKWFLCLANDEVVGLTGMIPDYYKVGEARFRGAYVPREHRGKGIGLAVMKEALRLARKLGQNRMVVYTFS